MRWSDIDFDHAAIGFSRALVEGPTGPVLRPTKNRRTYRVALDPASVQLLEHRPPRRARRRLRASSWRRLRVHRRPRRATAVAAELGHQTLHHLPATSRAGHFRLHDLRHFMATTMLAAGVPVPVVSERLCHARTSTTVNIYAHAMPGADRDAANLLADLLNPEHP